MFALQRMQMILDYLVRHGAGTVADLSRLFNVSEMTIRRDLARLAADHPIRRTHGGAVYLDSAAAEPAFEVKEVANRGLKERIALYAAQHFVGDNGVIILEGGTTVARMAPHLGGHTDLTVVTNGLRSVRTLSGLLPESTVLCSGGMLRENSLTFVGPVAEQFFRRFHANRVFLSATGLTLKDGFTDPSVLESQVKREMLSAADEHIVLLDSTKFDQRSFTTSFGLDEIHVLITDAGVPPAWLPELRERGIDVHVA
jgi:DeoR/GlpR family transcriptional regulator of sugar metabolism